MRGLARWTPDRVVWVRVLSNAPSYNTTSWLHAAETGIRSSGVHQFGARAALPIGILLLLTRGAM